MTTKEIRRETADSHCFSQEGVMVGVGEVKGGGEVRGGSEIPERKCPLGASR